MKRYERGESGKTDTTDTEYKQAFEDFGVNVEKTDPAEASRRLRRRSNPLDLAFYLDDWALFRAQHPAQEIDAAVDRDTPWRRLVTVARATDPDPWRDSLRRLVGGTDPEAVKRLADDEKALGAQPARSLLLLAQLLETAEDNKRAEKILKRAWTRRPDDFWISSQLGRISEKERVRFSSIAVALHPESAQAHVALAEAYLASHTPMPLSNSGGNFACADTRSDRILTDDLTIRKMVRANMEDVADLNTITVVCYFKDKAPKLEMYNVLPYPRKVCPTRS